MQDSSGSLEVQLKFLGQGCQAAFEVRPGHMVLVGGLAIQACSLPTSAGGFGEAKEMRCSVESSPTSVCGVWEEVGCPVDQSK